MNKFYFVYITNEYVVKEVNFVITNVVTWYTKYTIVRSLVTSHHQNIIQITFHVNHDGSVKTQSMIKLYAG